MYIYIFIWIYINGYIYIYTWFINHIQSGMHIQGLGYVGSEFDDLRAAGTVGHRLSGCDGFMGMEWTHTAS